MPDKASAQFIQESAVKNALYAARRQAYHKAWVAQEKMRFWMAENETGSISLNDFVQHMGDRCLQEEAWTVTDENV